MSDAIPLPKSLLAVPKVARCHQILSKATAAHRAAELEFNRLESSPPPASADAFDEADAVRRLAQAKAHDQVHGTSEADKVAAAIAAERDAGAKAQAKAESAAAKHREAVEKARLERDAAYAVLYSARGALQSAIHEAAPEILAERSRAAFEAAAALFEDVEELKAVKFASLDGWLGSGVAHVPASYLRVTLHGLPAVPEEVSRAKRALDHADGVVFE